jgi:hypothetical protein
MDIRSEDCRVSGYVAGTKHYIKAEHLPTGVSVDLYHKGAGWKRELMAALQQAVDRHMDDQLAKLR